MLPLRQVGEDFLLNGWETRLAANEALVTLDQACERFVR